MNPSRRRRPRGDRPRFEAAMERQSLVPLTVDFYNRLHFSDIMKRTTPCVRDGIDAGDLTAWQRVFPGRES